MPKTKKSDAEKEREAAAERQAKLNEADADFREDVRKAGEKRDKAREKAGAPTNIAERAWNETKADEDPDYRDTALTHRQKLDDVVAAVRQTGNADVVGLEEFEEKVRELLAEEGIEPGTGALVAADTPGRPAEDTAATGTTKTAAADKKGK